MVPSFHNADKPTHRRVMVVGLLFCLAFVVISFSLRPLPESGHALVKATGWSALRANRTRQIDARQTDGRRFALNDPAICCLAIGDRLRWR
jgi:hypothetical protein